MDSIVNPHLNNDLGSIIAFPGETFGLGGLRFQIAISNASLTS
jgi:hypothetical protein